jgi:hypothetical protein
MAFARDPLSHQGGDHEAAGISEAQATDAMLAELKKLEA